MTEYYIPTGDGNTEYVEKRSRFLGKVRRVETEEEARGFIESMKKQYHDARHNCWCYIIKEGGIVRYSDDGEPQGTAGQPMLNVFQKEEITNVVCVVTRYFGGILLGAGGLCRAYTKAAKDALDDAGRSVVRRWVEVLIPCSYSLFARVGQEIEALKGVVTETEYGAEVMLTALLPEGTEDELNKRLLDLSAGTIEMMVCGEELRDVPL